MMSVLVMTMLSIGVSLADIKDVSAGDSTSLVPGVTDLQVESCGYRTGVLYIDLKWTSPRNSPAYTVSRYDIRVAQTVDQINKNFSAAPKINPGLVVHGSLKPSGSSTAEELTTKLPIKAVWRQYVFALKTFDLKDKPSPLSNIANIALADCLTGLSSQTPPATSEPSGRKKTTSGAKKATSVLGPVIGSVFGALTVMALIGFIAIKKYKAKKIKIESRDVLTADMTEPSVAPNHIELEV